MLLDQSSFIPINSHFPKEMSLILTLTSNPTSSEDYQAFNQTYVNGPPQTYELSTSKTQKLQLDKDVKQSSQPKKIQNIQD